MKAIDEDIENRRPVWEALSDLFLDTDIAIFLEGRARVLAASPYSIAELEEILIHEVYPVCSPNLLSVAGEWAGFNSQWLEEKILAQQSFSRRLLACFFKMGANHFLASADWLDTRARVEALRCHIPEKSQ